jgi:acetyltransferase-like isoleucine patch superfamily enzyme
MNIISKKANIGKNVEIGDYTIIEDGCIIGDNCKIGPFSIIRKNAKIGNNCKLTAYDEIRENVVIGDNCTFGSRCTICAETIIGNNVTIKYGFVSTTMDFNSKKDLKAGTVGDNSMVGANVMLAPNGSIGNNSVIGACSQVRSVVGDNEVWFGNPAKFYRINDR